MSEAHETSERARDGYVYLLAVPNYEGVYKIGLSRNPENRLRTFNVKLPFPVKFEHVIKTDDMYELEKLLHQRYSLKRLRGSEFFRLVEDDVKYIKLLGQHVSIDNVDIPVDTGFKMKTDVKPKNVKVITLDITPVTNTKRRR